MTSSTNVLVDLATLIAMQQPRPSDYFAVNLMRVLTHQALSINAAADKWKMAQKTLESFVKQTRVPSINTAHAVAEAAGFELWQMLQEHFDPANPPVMQPITPNAKKFYEELAALIRRHREALP